MKKTQLKKILKPLIKECVKEIMVDEGVLSGIVSEVARGMGGVQINGAPPKIVAERSDSTLKRMQRNAFNTEQTVKLKEHKSKLMAAIGGDAYNGVDLFEGTTAAPAQASATQMASPLSGQAPTDAGVDITNLFGSVSTNWNAHMNVIKERK